MSDKVLARKGYVSADFLSGTYRISGDVNLRGMTLVDGLNEKMSTFVRAENVYVSPIDDPAVFTAQYNLGQLRKENIGMVVLTREEDGVARHGLYNSMPTQPVLFNLFATLPGFEVRGGLRLTSMVDIENMLMQSIDRFITIYKATATVTNHPEIQFSGGAIVLNLELATLFCIEKAATN